MTSLLALVVVSWSFIRHERANSTEHRHVRQRLCGLWQRKIVYEVPDSMAFYAELVTYQWEQVARHTESDVPPKHIGGLVWLYGFSPTASRKLRYVALGTTWFEHEDHVQRPESQGPYR